MAGAAGVPPVGTHLDHHAPAAQLTIAGRLQASARGWGKLQRSIFGEILAGIGVEPGCVTGEQGF